MRYIDRDKFIIPRQRHTEINRATLNRLYPEHDNFGGFLKRISEDCKPGKGGQCDEVKTPEELEMFVESKEIR